LKENNDFSSLKEKGELFQSFSEKYEEAKAVEVVTSSYVIM
jgi:hypothetical protein